MEIIVNTTQPILNSQNIHGHHHNCAIKAAMNAPKNAPAGPLAPTQPNTRFFRSPLGYMFPKIPIPHGIKRANPIPCKARQIMKNSTET